MLQINQVIAILKVIHFVIKAFEHMVSCSISIYALILYLIATYFWVYVEIPSENKDYVWNVVFSNDVQAVWFACFYYFLYGNGVIKVTRHCFHFIILCMMGEVLWEAADGFVSFFCIYILEFIMEVERFFLSMPRLNLKGVNLLFLLQWAIDQIMALSYHNQISEVKIAYHIIFMYLL